MFFLSTVAVFMVSLDNDKNPNTGGQGGGEDLKGVYREEKIWSKYNI